MRAPGLLAALICAGCAAGGALFEERVTGLEVFSNYTRNQVAALAASGAPVVLAGDLPGGASAEAVLADLRLPPHLPQTPLRLAPPGPAPAGAQRFVLQFGLAAPNNPATACSGGPSGGAAPTLQVAATYCVGSQAATSAKLSHARMLTPGDGEFGPAMTRLFTAITPRASPSRDRDRCRRLNCP